ncbi:MAG: L-rhamnose mutarotase [Cyclobacteriaceae bacterium]|nr:L-rhamnose mutarotase [Cyclobacteriaceae bacterium]
MLRYCFALDLKDDPKLIDEYDAYHKKVWPEIVSTMKEAGIKHLEIYRTGNRLFMVMETKDNFSLIRKGETDAINSKVQEWEKLMWNYQQALPNSKPGEKWVLMTKIFTL